MLVGTDLSGLGSFAGEPLALDPLVWGPLALGPFAAAGMLLWGLVALLPILLHWLRRRRTRTVQWGAMQFLQAAIARRAQKFQFWRLLLLCLRVAAVLLLAAALARPLPEDAATQGKPWSRPPTLRVLVLDTSYSMQTLVDPQSERVVGSETPRTRFAAAQAAAIEICQTAAASDGFLLLALSDPPRAIIPTVSERAEQTAAEIRRLNAGEGTADLPATLAAVKASIREAVRTGWSGPVDVILFSDLQQATWQSLPDSLPQLASGEVESGEVESGEEEIAIRFLVWDAAERLPGANATVGPLERDPSAAAVDDSQVWLSPIIHHGGEAIRGRLAQLLVDGQVEQSQTFDLKPGGSQMLLWSTRLAPGRHAIEVRIGDDALAVDNRSRAIAEVSPALSVAAFGPAASDTRYFALAAAPGGAGPVEVRSFPLSQLPQTELGRFDVWALCDPVPLGEAARRRLAQHLEQGGGVVWWLGPNWRSGQAADTPPLDTPPLDAPPLDAPPATGWIALEPREVETPDIDPLGYRSRIVQPFEAFPGSGLLSLPVFRYWTLELGSGWQPAVAIGEGDPLIASLASEGSGRQVLIATPPSPGAGSPGAGGPEVGGGPWNALIAWPSFVPLVQEILRWADAGEPTSRQFIVGERVVGRSPEARFAGQLASEAGATLETHVQSRSGPTVRWTAGVASQAGFYWWSASPQAAPGDEAAPLPAAPLPAAQPPVIAVNVDPGEGRLEKLGELPAPWQRLGESTPDAAATPAAAAERSAAAPAADPPALESPGAGRELFWGLLLVALGLLVAESLVVKILEGQF
ncbi:BatA domain-containing protein [Candidatus Laterigemmans baculatus]|uniref:BatA domain-containing protein n=1 Tax=Candidatus Laterigemmans baculatus TaxID=2770505 RepID=UPI0013DB7196|nr:BatA domain-containing protein [Candidatus Laterigemmans baculatus]